MKYHFVYITTNIVNSKKYIGKHSTENLDDRYLGSGKILSRSIKKHGRENFEREIVEFFDSSTEAYLNEEIIIDDFDAVESSNFYNLTKGGLGNKGYIPLFTEEHRRKISEALSGRTLSDSHRLNISKAGKDKNAWNKGLTGIYSEESLSGISTGLKKYYEENPVSLETRLKISNSLTGRVSPFKDHNHSEESKSKTSLSVKEVLNTPEMKKILSDAAHNADIKICPWCNFQSKYNVIYRYHFDNCPQNPGHLPKEKVEIICPHCGKVGSVKSSMDRWHFDNCRSKIKISVGNLSFEI